MRRWLIGTLGAVVVALGVGELLVLGGEAGAGTFSNGTGYVVEFGAPLPRVGTTYGTGTLGLAGPPQMRAFSQLTIGSKLWLVCSGVAEGTDCILAVSGRIQDPPLDLSNGATLNVGLPIMIFSYRRANAGGRAEWSVHLSPGLAGLTFYVQAWVVAGVPPDYYATTPGLRIEFP